MAILPPFAVTSMLALARRYMEQGPSQVLGPDGDPYLERWWLEKDNRVGSVYLHRMIRSDRDLDFHDHPADNLSIVLSGVMEEHTPRGVTRWHPGAMVARRAVDRHRIVIAEPLITMWIMGPKIREWGFWEEAPEGERFVLSQEYFRQRGYF